MTFKLRAGYPAEHLVFGREEPGPFPPALPILAAMLPLWTPHGAKLSTAGIIYFSVLVKSSPGRLAEVRFRSWLPPSGIIYLLVSIKCSTDFRIRQTNKTLSSSAHPSINPREGVVKVSPL